MWLIIGLGNPGPRYASTRHNVGFMVLERVARAAGCVLQRRRFEAVTDAGRLGGERVFLAAPQTYMNLSGRSVERALRFYGQDPSSLLVIHDDVDLPFGRLKVKQGGGHGGHRGVRSIIEAIGSADFVRVRVGIGRPPGPMDTSDYVLAPFDPEEREVLDDILDAAADAVRVVVEQGVATAMNRFNGMTFEGRTPATR